MKFPITELNVQDYNRHLNSLLVKTDTRVFIDTNILALCYKLHGDARKVLLDWLSDLRKKGMVKTPVWTLNEYTKRFLRKGTHDYFNTGKSIKKINGDFKEYMRYIKMHVDAASVETYGYTTMPDFEKALNEASSILEKLGKGSKAKDEQYIIDIHVALEKVLDGTQLTSDIFDLSRTLHDEGPIRFANQLPPGFEDGGKALNANGDLIIWREILNYCRAESTSVAILLTNDGKRDWVYAPNKVLMNGRSTFNKGDHKLADPRLTYEFYLATKSYEFHILDLEHLVKLQIDKRVDDFRILGSALQIVHEAERSSETVSETAVEDREQEAGEAEPTALVAQEVTEQKAIYNEFIPIDPSALADISYEIKDRFVASVIRDLKAYSWYEQNPAINKLYNAADELASVSPSDLFVLGRNIYQAACGNSNSAVRLIMDLTEKTTTFGSVDENLFTGALFELYFNREGRLRKGDFKTQYITHLFKAACLDKYQKSLSFIKEHLIPYVDFLPVLPGAPLSTEITFHMETKQATSKIWGDISEIISFKLGNEELLVPFKEWRYIGFEELFEDYPMDIDFLKTRLEKTFAIPKDMIEIMHGMDNMATNDITAFKAKGFFWRGKHEEGDPMIV